MSLGKQRLSVIVPARNEAGCIAAALARIAVGRPDELIVVDANSVDATAAIARRYGATVVGSDLGRGRQLAVGIAAAGGEVVLIVHADTLLPVDYRQQIQAVLSRRGDVAVGAFRLRIESEGLAYRLIEAAVHWRSILLRLPYGDQAMFLPSGILRQIVDLERFEVMEDVELVRQARRLGGVAIADASVITSARRWKVQGVARTTLINQACLLSYWLGADPGRIAAWRQRMAARGRGRTMAANPTGIPEHDQQRHEG